MDSANNTSPTIAFDDEEYGASAPIHPALDAINGTLYVSVRASIEKTVQQLVLTSEGEIFTQEQWARAAPQRGLLSHTGVDISDITPRWNNAGLRAFRDGELAAPEWRDVFDAIHNAFAAHLVVVDNRYLVVLTLYTMMTYFHPLFDFLPILHLRGPSESGKSRAAQALGEVAFNGLVRSSATPASVFRKAHQGRFTQIITEADDLAEKRSSDPFVKQLQGACTKGEAVVEVTEKTGAGAFRPTAYYGFNPRVIVSTRDFKALTLRNRCIRLDFVKSPHANQAKLHRSITGAGVWKSLRDGLFRILLLRWQEVAQVRDTLRDEWREPEAPTGRTFDKWLPLATMAKLVGEDIFAVVAELARINMDEQREDAVNSQAGILFRFALWLVRDGDVAMRRSQVWKEFIRGENPNGFDSETPMWARASNEPITAGQLRQMFQGERKLWEELKRLQLVPLTPSRHERTGDCFELAQLHIRGIAEQYIKDSSLPNDDDGMQLYDAKSPSGLEEFPGNRTGTFDDDDIPF